MGCLCSKRVLRVPAATPLDFVWSSRAVNCAVRLSASCMSHDAVSLRFPKSNCHKLSCSLFLARHDCVMLRALCPTLLACPGIGKKCENRARWLDQIRPGTFQHIILQKPLKRQFPKRAAAHISGKRLQETE